MRFNKSNRLLNIRRVSFRAATIIWVSGYGLVLGINQICHLEPFTRKMTSLWRFQLTTFGNEPVIGRPM